MGYYVRYQEMAQYQSLVSKWTDLLNTELETLLSGIYILSAEEGIQGQTAKTVRNYMKDFHARAVEGIRVVLYALQENLQLYVQDYRNQIDASDEAVFCEEAFADYVTDIKKKMQDLDDVQEQIETILSDMDYADIRRPDVNEVLESGEYLVRQIDSLAEHVAAMEEEHLPDTEEAEELIRKLKGFIEGYRWRPASTSLQDTISHIRRGTSAKELDQLTAAVRGNVLYASLEACSAEYLQWLRSAEGFGGTPYLCAGDNADAKDNLTVTIGYGFTFDIEQTHWKELNAVTGWSEDEISAIIYTLFPDGIHEPVDLENYRITEEQARELFDAIQGEYLALVEEVIAYWNKESGGTAMYSQSELEAIFDYVYMTGYKDEYVEDDGYMLFYYLRRDQVGAVAAVKEYGTDNRRRLNQMNLFFNGIYAFSENLDELRETLGF